ncbi:MAG: Mur ligase family protein [Rikenellaceae bacterium]
MPLFQQVGSVAYKPGLERVESFSQMIGSPHLAMPTIHVAGTNGKGSTSHMLAAVLQSAGYRVGLFTSPHLRDFRERMRVDGRMIERDDVVAFVANHREAMERCGLSFFEMTAAMAFDFFARSRVDVAVVETGLGGRLDATNIVVPQLSIITNIALDHTQYLGDSVAQIAAEKGGIIKRGRPVVLGESSSEYTYVFEQRAQQMQSRLTQAQSRFAVERVEVFADFQRITMSAGAGVYDLDLLGEYQHKNLVTLLAAVEAINSSEDISLEVGVEALHAGLRRVVALTNLAGRWQVLGRDPLMVCDTGHNPHGLREVARQIARQRYDRLYCVVGFANDKRLEEILPLLPTDAYYIFTQANISRAYDAHEVAAVARGMGMECEVVVGVGEAVAAARARATSQDMIYIGGSTFVVAEIEDM